MMTELEQYRGEIDEIDREMAALFQRRMLTVEQVAQYKKREGMAVLDSGREAVVIDKNSAYITDKRLVASYKKFMQAAMDISKDFQREII